MKKTNLLKIANEVRLKKGTSYNLVTSEVNPNNGFMVALPGFELKVAEGNLELFIAEYVKQHAYLLSNPERWFGIWFDGTDYIFDVSELIEDKAEAIEAGILREQIAIWDNASNDEIRLPEPQRAGTETQKREYARLKSKQI